MKVYKTKEFTRLARKGGLSDPVLCQAVARAERGLVDAQIGRFLIKRRIARAGQGRSGGFRSILFYREKDRAVFLHLFAKSEQDNLSAAEQDAYRRFAAELAGLNDQIIGVLVRERKWIEIDYEGHQKEISERAAEVPASGSGGPARGRRDQ
jgi:hypothetical protein